MNWSIINFKDLKIFAYQVVISITCTNGRGLLLIAFEYVIDHLVQVILLIPWPWYSTLLPRSPVYCRNIYWSECWLLIQWGYGLDLKAGDLACLGGRHFLQVFVHDVVHVENRIGELRNTDTLPSGLTWIIYKKEHIVPRRHFSLFRANANNRGSYICSLIEVFK